MREQNIKDLFGDYQAAWRRLPSGDDAAGEPARGLPHEEGANPALLQNWVRLTRPAIRQGSPIFEVWTAMARPPAERFEQQAPAYPDESVSRGRRAGAN